MLIQEYRNFFQVVPRYSHQSGLVWRVGYILLVMSKLPKLVYANIPGVELGSQY